MLKRSGSNAVGVPKSVVDTVLKGPRFDIISDINLGRSPNPNRQNPIDR
jgi:hypothetical protein